MPLATPSLTPVDALLEEATALKVFPAAALRIQKLAHDASSTPRDMANAVASDPVLAGKLLKFANSPYYGVARTVVSVEDAIKILGYRQTQDVALALAIFSMGDKASPYRQRLWQHATGTAVLARLLAKYTRDVNPGTAFFVGLVHDIGAQVFLQVREPDYAAILDAYRDGDPRVLIEERKAFGMDHAGFGATCLESWGFPEIIRHGVAEHHRVRAHNRGERVPVLLLPAIVALAETLVGTSAAGADPEILLLRAVRDPLNRMLGVGEGQLQIALSVFQEEREELEAILG